jgi:hypothetical protein
MSNFVTSVVTQNKSYKFSLYMTYVLRVHSWLKSANHDSWGAHSSDCEGTRHILGAGRLFNGGNSRNILVRIANVLIDILTSCSPVDSYWSFWGTYRLHIQGRTVRNFSALKLGVARVSETSDPSVKLHDILISFGWVAIVTEMLHGFPQVKKR